MAAHEGEEHPAEQRSACGARALVHPSAPVVAGDRGTVVPADLLPALRRRIAGHLPVRRVDGTGRVDVVLVEGAQVEGAGLIGRVHGGLGHRRVGESDEMTDLMSHDRLQIVDGVFCGEGQLVEGRVDLDVRVEDGPGLGVVGHRGLGQCVILVLVGEVVVAEEDHVDVGPLVVEAGGVAGSILVLAEGERRGAARAGELGPGEEGAADRLPEQVRVVLGGEVPLEAEADAASGPVEREPLGGAAVVVPGATGALAGAGATEGSGLGGRQPDPQQDRPQQAKESTRMHGGSVPQPGHLRAARP
jgi:hypothetical protein